MIIPCYHSVHPTWDVDLSVSPAEFDRQCRRLARFRALSSSDVVARTGAAPRRSREVLVTFDDGFADNAEFAAPILRRHGLRATFFVVAGSLMQSGVTVDWIREIDAAAAPPLLDEDAIRSLASDGHEIANHSWSHRDLTQLSERECVDDLRASRELLSDLLHRQVRILAYPFGRHSSHVRRAAELSGHDGAFSLPDGPEPAGTYAIPRVGIYRRNRSVAFRLKTSSRYLDARTSRVVSGSRGVATRWRSRT